MQKDSLSSGNLDFKNITNIKAKNEGEVLKI